MIEYCGIIHLMDLHITDSSPEVQVISTPSLTLTFTDEPIRYYRHGWQSWTLAAWTDPVDELPVMKPDRFHSRQTDPVYARYPYPNGSWVGAVELQNGIIILLGALSLDAHVAICNGKLQGWYEDNCGEWLVTWGMEESVFLQYSTLLATRFSSSSTNKPPRVWCSWYSLYKEVNEEVIQHIIEGLGNLPFDVIQIDDGWQVATGDWVPNSKFPSGMKALASKIRSTGRKAGLWIAPLSISENSRLHKEHPDWLLKDFDGNLASSGYEWGGNTFALDATHPKAAEWLENTICSVTEWGFEYLKLDFLYAGALPGNRHKNLAREAAYRSALGIMRRAAGDAYLLSCGAPILPSLGLCDGMRVGPDVANSWDSNLYSYLLYNQTTPGVRNAIRTTVNRLWLKPLVHVDPDIAFFHKQNHLSSQQSQLFEELTDICDFKATSDLPDSWTEAERSNVAAWLERKSGVVRLGRYIFSVRDRTVDFSPAMDLPPKPSGVDSILRLVLAFLGNQLWVLKLWDFLIRTKPQKTQKIK